MKRYSIEMKKKIVTINIQDGRTIATLSTEYSVLTASINNWIRDFDKECQEHQKPWVNLSYCKKTVNLNKNY